MLRESSKAKGEDYDLSLLTGTRGDGNIPQGALLVAFAEAVTCRRRALLGYFGETLDEDCGNCDVCLDPPELYDGTEDAQKALSAVYRVGERFGIGHVIDVLRGAQTQALLERGHDKLSVYGIGAGNARDVWGSIIRQLIHRGYLTQDIARYSVLGLTAEARPVLRGEEVVSLARPRARVAKVKIAKRTRAGSQDQAELAMRDEELFESLKDLRRELASTQKVPAYVVFSDATLVAMATMKPASSDEFLQVPGVGQTKLERYGEIFMERVKDYLQG